MCALARMRDRVVKVGFCVFDYEASTQLLETIDLPWRRLAQFVFNELLELNSNGRRDIRYGLFGSQLVRAWEHSQCLLTEARILLAEARISEERSG